MAETLEQWYTILQDTVDKYNVLIENEENQKTVQKYTELRNHYTYYLDLRNKCIEQRSEENIEQCEIPIGYCEQKCESSKKCCSCL